MTVDDQLVAWARLYDNEECCGLIIDNLQVYPCRNVHPDKQHQFAIHPDDWLDAEDEGEITGVFHSHVNDVSFLTAADRRAQLQTGLPWKLIHRGRVRTFRPVPHLLGRQFVHGSLDCFSLWRDAYHLAGIDIPDFERTNGWWLRGENLYLANFPATGFYQVAIEDARPGDLILRQQTPTTDPSHVMLLLDGGEVVHHEHTGRISRREAMRPAYVKQTHSVWRHRECSNLDLRAIYSDFSAKEF